MGIGDCVYGAQGFSNVSVSRQFGDLGGCLSGWMGTLVVGAPVAIKGGEKAKCTTPF
jgi:hypothetical protein